MRSEATLADVIHDALCAEHVYSPEKCRRYAKGYGDPHYDFYQARAAVLDAQLAPEIGSANVLPVVRIVLSELV